MPVLYQPVTGCIDRHRLSMHQIFYYSGSPLVLSNIIGEHILLTVFQDLNTPFKQELPKPASSLQHKKPSGFKGYKIPFPALVALTNMLIFS